MALPRTASRHCTRCGQPCSGSRCRACVAATADPRPRRKALGNRRDIALRRKAVEAHRAEYGDWCPGWAQAPHPASDLCADHITEVALGGSEDGPFQVLCRGCNSTKGNLARAAANTPAPSRPW